MLYRGWIILGLGTISALLSCVSFVVVPYLGPGVVFGVVVALPYSRLVGDPWWRTRLLIAASPWAYFLAVWLFNSLEGYGAICGGLGAALAFVPLIVGPDRGSPPGVFSRTVMVGGVTGGVGGALIRGLSNSDGYWEFKMGSAIILWQMGAAAILALSMRRVAGVGASAPGT